MKKVYREHPEFGQFCIVDSKKGFLKEIGEEEYRAFLPADEKEKSSGIQVLQGNGAVVFTGETPPTRTRFARRVYFQITRNCCLQCDFCFIKAKKGRARVPLEAASKMAEFLGRQGLVEARLTGGEPTTHPHLFEIVRAFQDAGVYVSLACWLR